MEHQEKRSRAFWEQQVSAYEKSGKSRRAFCEHDGLNYWTFNNWMRRLRQDTEPFMLLPLETSTSGSSASELKIIFKDQTTLIVPSLFDRPSLTWVIKVLREA